MVACVEVFFCNQLLVGLDTIHDLIFNSSAGRIRMLIGTAIFTSSSCIVLEYVKYIT